MLGIAVNETGQFTRAVFALERALSVQPENARARAELGRALFSVGDNQVDKAGTVNTVALTPAPTPAPSPAPNPGPETQTALSSGFTSFSLTSSSTNQRRYGTGTLTVGDGTDAANNTLPVAFAATASTGTLTGVGTVIAASGTVANSDYMVIGTFSTDSWTGDATVEKTGFAAGIPTASFTSVTGKRATYNLLHATPVYTG